MYQVSEVFYARDWGSRESARRERNRVAEVRLSEGLTTVKVEIKDESLGRGFEVFTVSRRRPSFAAERRVTPGGTLPHVATPRVVQYEEKV